MYLGGERYCLSKVSCPRTQHNVPGQGSSLDSSKRKAGISVSKFSKKARLAFFLRATHMPAFTISGPRLQNVLNPSVRRSDS